MRIHAKQQDQKQLTPHNQTSKPIDHHKNKPHQTNKPTLPHPPLANVLHPNKTQPNKHNPKTNKLML